MLRNKIGPVFNATNGFFLCLFSSFFEKSSSFCRENEIFKKKNKKAKKMDQFLTLEKAKIGPVFNYLYIYIYMHAVELKTGPRFGGLCVRNWSKL